MPARVRQIQSNWANGVMSPRTLGRIDMDKYYASAEVIRDLIVLPQGGVKRRPGTQYVADAMGPSRLIPFVFAPGVAYILELGNKTMRFYYAYNDKAQSPSGTFQPPYTAGAQIQSLGSPLQLTTPWDTSVISLWDIQYAQQGDIMYFAHPNYPLQKLIRFGAASSIPGPTDTSWRLIQPAFKCPPIDSFKTDISGGTITLTPGAKSGTGVTFTASAAAFLAGDVGRFIFNAVDGGLAQIATFTDSTHVVCNIIDPLASTSAIPAGSWFIEGDPSVWAGVGAINAGNWVASKQFGVGATDTVITFNSYPSQGATAPSQVDTFRAADVGRYLSVAGCNMLITAVNSTSNVSVTYMSVPESTFTGTVAGEIRVQPSAPGAWSFHDPAATSGNGYFGVVAFFQDRLLLASTAQQPKTVYGSVTGDYENFAGGTLDSDPVQFTISGGKLDTIQWMAGTPVAGRLAIETDAAEYVAYGSGSVDQAITPTNITVQANSAQGGSKILPILVDSALIYVQRYRTKVYEFSYNIYQSSFSSKDMALFAEHLTHAGIKEVAYQPLPYKIIWYVTNDGRLLGMTYDRVQDVCAWHEHRTGYADSGYGAVGTGDRFLSVASIPNPSTQLLNPNLEGGLDYVGNADPSYASDLVWTVVARKRNGATVYTVEMLNEDLMADSCSLSPTLTTSTEVTDSHLGGRTVIATGKPTQASKTYFPFDSLLDAPAVADASGDLILTIPATSITAYGLPFQPTLVTVRPEVRQGGSIQGLMQRWSDLYLRLYQTLGVTVNGKRATFQNVPGVLPGAPAASLEPGVLSVPNVNDTMSDEIAPITVDVRMLQLGYDRFGRVTITQPDPYPITLLAMYGTLSIGDN